MSTYSMTTLPLDSAEPVDHAEIKADDVIGCVLTQTLGSVVWYGPFTVIANDRDADVIVVRRDHDHDATALDYFVEGDDLIAWPNA
jgi:3-dehydroquinate synthase class II